MGVRLSARRLNRATLARQSLLERTGSSVPEAVQRLGALQAQEPASPYIALWNRLAQFDPIDLDSAFRDGAVVKSSLLRTTLHAVHEQDYHFYYQAMLPSLRASRLADRRFRESGLSTDDVDSLLDELVEFLREPRTGSAVQAWLEESLGERSRMAWWALRTYAPLHRAPTGEPWSFHARPAYVAARSANHVPSHDDSVRHLFQRYLVAFGPATSKDFEQFTLLRRPVVKCALEALDGQVIKLDGPGTEALYDVPGAPLPSADTHAPPRLLAMWDSVLLAYADRSRVIPPEYRSFVIRRNGDVLPTLLVDGYVAGVWRAVEGGIEVTAFEPVSDEAWDALEAEAKALTGFLAGREPTVYRRYQMWWKDLPGVQRRLLSS